MALCRVYQRPDGSVAVIHPNPRMRQIGESDADFLDRICLQDAPKSGLAHFPFTDIPVSQLPPRKDRDIWTIRQGQPGVR